MNPIDLRLYLVTDTPEAYPEANLAAGVEAALAGGVTVVQYRPTRGSRRAWYETARALRDLLRPRGVPLLINDHVDLALAVEAEGVHVGQEDLPVDVVRALLGAGKVVGLSITAPGQLERVPAGVIDYVGVGPVFPTGSKADAAPALGLEGLASRVRESVWPVVAIGGITTANAAAVAATGVAGLAVISALSRAADPAEAGRALRRHFPSP